jgi:chemotaxis protein CheX
VSVEDLQGIVTQVWSVYVQGDRPNGLTMTRHAPPASFTVSAYVPLSGQFTGYLAICTTGQVADQIAASMLDLDPEQISDSDVIDAIGELANITGGNFKALLPQPTTLGLPAVLFDTDARLHIPGAKPAATLHAEWASEPVRVSLYTTDST